MSKLFEPLELGGLRLENRIIVAPMCQYSAQQGSATDWHVMHLGSLALSGAGLLILEATGVSPEAGITAWDLGLHSDENEAALAKVLAAIRVHSDIPVAIQLAHAGRKGSSLPPWEGGSQIPAEAPNGWRTVSSSALPHGEGEEAPAALDEAGLAKVRADFVTAAERAARLGIDAVELHFAHGYLFHQFLSPVA
ncbi:MAG: oxidoreductase, partial [Pseudomonadota bacterium]